LILWAATTLTTLILFSFILLRRLNLQFPFFTAYLGVNLLQTLTEVVLYHFYPIESDLAYTAVWGSQAAVILARSLAAAEFCYRVLGGYTGVWALARRVLVLSGFLVLALALYFGRDGFRYYVMTLEIASEASIATLVALTCAFAAYYQAQLEKSAVLLGLGLGFHSCVKILNDAVLAHYFHSYAKLWNEVGMISFLCMLSLWILAMRAVAAKVSAIPQLGSPQLYRTLSPQLNRRLGELNDHLVRLWKLEQPKL
jgi:hypothetical protein